MQQIAYALSGVIMEMTSNFPNGEGIRLLLSKRPIGSKISFWARPQDLRRC